MTLTSEAVRFPAPPSPLARVPRADALSPWDQWSPQDYLRDYYRFVEPDEIETIRFLVGAARHLTEPAPTLVFGCGPTLHHVFAIAPYASEIHLADYLPANLAEIRAWIERRSPMHDWSAFVRYTLQCEGIDDPSRDDVSAREDMVRHKVNRLVQADAGDDDPLHADRRASYPMVVSCYCADSATDDKVVWRRYMSNIASMVSPGGLLITAALRHAWYYKVGDLRFPSANIDERDLTALLAHALGQDVVVEAHELPSHEALGYTGIVLGSAVKRPALGPRAS